MQNSLPKYRIRRIEYAALLAATIFLLGNAAWLGAQPSRGKWSIRYLVKLDEKLDSFTYEKVNLDSALKICKEFLDIESLPDHFRKKAEKLSSFIEDYSDHGRQPLVLYFQAQKYILEKSKKGDSRERLLRLGNSLLDLLRQYPSCKLAGFVQYQLASHYKDQIGNGLSYLSTEEAHKRAIREFERILTSYPEATFEFWDYPYDFRIGVKIAPIAQIKIAWLYQSARILDKAVQSYQTLTKNYPEAADKDGRPLALSAYVSMLNIYSGEMSEQFVDTLKAKEICHTLINSFKNQKYEIEEWYYGEIHPEAYMRLAELESDPNEAIRIYTKIIEEFPGSRAGKSNSDAEDFYSRAAQIRIDELNRVRQ